MNHSASAAHLDPLAAGSFAAMPRVDVIECDVRPTPPKPLHIACALGGTDLGRSGIGTYVRELLPPLVEQLTTEGGRLTVFGRPAEVAAFSDALAGADQRRIFGLPGGAGGNALWHLLRAGAFARGLGADVLLLPAANRRIVGNCGIPVVAVVHDLAQLRVAQKYDPLRMFYFRRVLLPAFRRPARVVAVSGATREDLVQSLGVPADRVRVVYNGVNADHFRALDPHCTMVADARRRAALDRRPYLLYPARLEHPGKNHVRLLKAFAQSGLAATHTLALCGADWGAEAILRARVAELKLDHAVKFLGFVPNGELPALIAGADGVLLLGLHEGFGLPPLEALSVGRPVCVSNTGALPEVVGALGVQCDPLSEDAIANALLRLVRDEEMRALCEREGPAWAARFTWTRTAQGLLEACHEAAG